MLPFPNHHIQSTQKDNELDLERGYKIGVSEQDLQSAVTKWGDIDTFCNEYGFYQDTAADKPIRGPESQSIFFGRHQPTLSESYDLQIFQKQYSHYIDNVGASSDGNEEKKEFLFSSSNLLKHDHTNFKICNEEQPSVPKDGTGVDNPKLSSENIVRLAGERFIDFASHMFIDTNTNVCPYSCNLTRLTEDDKMDVELVQLLFTVVEEVSHKKTDRACRLLSHCRKIASNRRRPVQKAELYFAEALAKKIERETGKIVSNIWEAENPIGPAISPKLNNLNAILACYRRLPFHFLFSSTIDRKVKFLF